jgi:hypothetical protein
MIGKYFSNGWKNRAVFSNDWKKFSPVFQWLENGPAPPGRRVGAAAGPILCWKPAAGSGIVKG